jgi:hypothetical protein
MNDLGNLTDEEIINLLSKGNKKWKV